MVIIWIIVSIIIFSAIVLIHEFWHFYAARFFWVKVDEFGLWIPPRAKKICIDKKWTLYSLNWLPLWWFVRLAWESNDTLNKNKKLNLVNKPVWQQSIIILAWVFMNFLLATIIFSILFFVWVKPIWINTKIDTDLKLKIIPTYQQAIDTWILLKHKWVILYPVKDSVAYNAWIIDWDILVNIKKNNQNIEIINTEQLIKIIWDNINNSLIFNIKRNNKLIEIPIIPESKLENNQEKWKIWSYLSENLKLNKDFEYNYWFFESIKYWFFETYNQSLLTIKWIWLLFRKIISPSTPTERTEAINDVSWPIWIVDLITNAISGWFVLLLILWAILSISLGVFNILPIPALDWWRFIFIIINGIIKKIFWKKVINNYFENIIHVLFFVFLIALSILIAYNDIVKIIAN